MADIVLTQVTKDVKRHLLALGSGYVDEEKLLSTIEQILQKCDQEEKHVVHLQLFLHLPYPHLEKVKDNPGDFVYLVPPIGYAGLSPQRYCQLIVSGEMIYNFMQMVFVLQNEEFIQELLTQVISLVFKDEEKKYRSFYPYILIILTKICRLKEVDKDTSGAESAVSEFFFRTCSKFLDEMLTVEAMPRPEKLSVILRLIGVSSMQKLDYIGAGSDLAELIEEWSYDLSNRVAQKTYGYFRDIFKPKLEQERSLRASKTMLMLGSNALKKLEVTHSDEKNWAQISKTPRITWLEFIGVHSFLTLSLVEKYSSEIDVELMNDLASQTSKWTKYKPKLTREDFQGEIGDFNHFVQVMKRFGDKERDRQVLLPKFLEFSYSEVFLTKDGLKIADKYLVPGADYETAVAYIQKAMRFDSIAGQSIPEKIKVVVLRILLCNPEVRKRKEAFVSEVFKNGTTSNFALSNFTMDINQVSSQIGSFEKETKDLNQIEHNEDIVFHICFQDPKEAVNCLMKHSLRSQHYKVLRIAKPFLKIPSGPISRKLPAIVNSCFQNLVETTEEANPFFEYLIKSVPEIISNDLICAVDVYQILKMHITEMILSNVLLLGKVSKLFSMIDSMVESCASEIDNQLMQEIYNFILGMSTFTNMFTNKKTGKDMLEIRRKCMNIRYEILKRETIQLPKLSEKKGESEKLNKYTLYEVGLVYIRVPSMRKHVQDFLKGPYNKRDEVQYGQLQNHILSWVLNSEPEQEWKLVMELTELVLISFDNLRTLNPVHLFNDSLLAANQSSLLKDSPSIIRQYLKLYKNCIQYCWEQEGFSKDDQVTIVETCVTLSRTMFNIMKKRRSSKERFADDTSIQQVLLVLLEILNWVVIKNPDFEETLKDKLLDAVLLLPPVEGKCQPIRKCILDRILKQSRARMMPLPDVVDNSRKPFSINAIIDNPADMEAYGRDLYQSGKAEVSSKKSLPVEFLPHP